MTRKSLFYSFLFLMLFVGQAVWAQDPTAAVEGTVSDVSGSVIYGAVVQIRSIHTGVIREQKTDEYGSFSFVALPVDDYRLQISSPQFASWLEPSLHLNVSQKLRLAVHLQPARQNETVEVTIGAEQLQATSNTVLGSVVSEQEVLDLPLNGRNFSQLGLLQVGVRPMTSGLTEQGGSRRSGHAYEVNGQRPESNNYLVDGMRVLNRADGGFALKPPIESIEEFKILTSTAPAEYGGTSGGITTIVTRSGGNQFHGNFYEFFRNDWFDARNYFSIKTEPLKQNQWGATFSGPVLKEKIFFFTYYEGFRNHQGITHGVTVPTLAERSGNFSASSTPLVDLTTGAAYQGNILPQGSMNSISKTILSWYPLPNTSSNVATSTRVAQIQLDQGGIKTDWIATHADTFSIRYAYSTGMNYNPYSILGSDIPGFPVGDYVNVHLGGLSHVHAFSPHTTLVSHISIFQEHYLLEKRFSGLSPQTWGFGYGSTLETATGAPAILVDGYSNLGDPVIGPRDTAQNDFEYGTSLGHTTGRHAWKTGAIFRRTQFNGYQGLYANGSFSFTSQGPTNNSFANFLLGRPMGFTQAGGDPTRHLRGWEFGAFALDEWKISPRLTLTYGLRYEITTPFSETDNKMNSFAPGKQSVVRPSAPPGILFPGDPGVGSMIAPIFTKGFMPRIGLAWDPTGRGNLVVHAAYGMFYDYLENGVGGPLRTASQTLPATIIRQLSGLTIGLSQPLSSVSDPWAKNSFAKPMGLFTIGNNLRPPYAQDWNLSTEKSLRTQVLDLSYVGGKGTYLPRFVEGNPAAYSSGATAANANKRRIYADCNSTTGACNVGAVALLVGNTNSTYHSGQISLSRHGKGNLDYTFSYTLSKTLDYVSSLHMAGPAPLLVTGETDIAQNPFDLKAEYGPSLFDARHRFVACGTYTIAVFQELRGPVRALLDGWQSNAILTVTSPTPFTVYDSRNVSLQAPHPSISGVWGDRPDWASDPNGGKHTVDAWVQRSAFRQLDATSEAGHFGNEGRNAVRGPGYGNLDFSMLKSIPMGERFKGQFRAECFNVLNHTNLYLPVDDLNSPNFGRILEANSPRVFQFALKINY